MEVRGNPDFFMDNERFNQSLRNKLVHLTNVMDLYMKMKKEKKEGYEIQGARVLKYYWSVKGFFHYFSSSCFSNYLCVKFDLLEEKILEIDFTESEDYLTG